MPASAAWQLPDPDATTSRLLAWYDANARALPWRTPPGEPAPPPYRVWLSEVMLQQTTVATVKPRFRRFVERWPTVESLAAAEETEVLKEWAGLGYYARARNLIACARAVAERGGFPSNAAGLRALPGLGHYTSAAVAAIAFGEPVAAVDTNVERVIARLAAIDVPVTEARAIIGQLAALLVPADRPGDFAQAMMDLGATICCPRCPACASCPLSAQCAAFASGNPAAFPAPKIKKERVHRHGTAWWIEHDHAVWLVRRPGKGLLGGMAALPGEPWDRIDTPDDAIAVVKHGFTHFTLDLAITHRDAPPQGPGWWHPLDQIAEAGLPTLYARAVEAVIARKEAHD